MKRKMKKIVLLTVAALCCGAVVVGGAWCSAQVDSSPCKEVCVVIEDSLERSYVAADELLSYLRSRGLSPLGKAMCEIDCHAIEQCLLSHDMIRTAACYKSPFDKICISLTQRIPMLCVLTNGECYYVDTDRRVMPTRQGVEAEVPTFRGAVSERAACEEYYDFVVWLQNNSYWGERISGIQVTNPKYLVLTQEGSASKIVLGELDGFEDKLRRLRTLYSKGMSLLDSTTYKEYDLRFKGQVVARK